MIREIIDNMNFNIHNKANQKIIKNLVKFNFNKEKSKNWNIEISNCCICLNNIENNEEVNFLPCEHLFHWNCCLNWLKIKNKCPICRLEIKD